MNDKWKLTIGSSEGKEAASLYEMIELYEEISKYSSVRKRN